MDERGRSFDWHAAGAALLALAVFAVCLAGFGYTAYFSVATWMGNRGLLASWRLPAFIAGVVAMPAFAFGAPLLRGRLSVAGPAWLTRGVDVAVYVTTFFAVITAFLFAGAHSGGDVGFVIALVVFLASLARAVKG